MKKRLGIVVDLKESKRPRAVEKSKEEEAEEEGKVTSSWILRKMYGGRGPKSGRR